MLVGVVLVGFVPVFGCFGVVWAVFGCVLLFCAGFTLVFAACGTGLCVVFLGLVLTLRAGLRTLVSVLKFRFGSEACSTFFSRVGAKTSNSSRPATRGHHGQEVPTNQ